MRWLKLPDRPHMALRATRCEARQVDDRLHTKWRCGEDAVHTFVVPLNENLKETSILINLCLRHSENLGD
jgi:hypothetical protein